MGSKARHGPQRDGELKRIRCAKPIDATDIPAYANPNREIPADPDAA